MVSLLCQTCPLIQEFESWQHIDPDQPRTDNQRHQAAGAEQSSVLGIDRREVEVAVASVSIAVCDSWCVVCPGSRLSAMNDVSVRLLAHLSGMLNRQPPASDQHAAQQKRMRDEQPHDEPDRGLQSPGKLQGGVIIAPGRNAGQNQRNCHGHGIPIGVESLHEPGTLLDQRIADVGSIGRSARAANSARQSRPVINARCPKDESWGEP